MLNTDPEQLDADKPVPSLATEPPVTITEAHKEEFFKAFLADRPYEEEFVLLNGHFRVKLKTTSMKENADLLAQISYDRDKGRIEGVNDYYFSRVAHYRLGLSLVSVNDIPFAEDITSEKNPTDKETGTSYVAVRANLFRNYQMIKMAALQTALKEFDQRVLKLVDAISDPAFWKAAA